MFAFAASFLQKQRIRINHNWRPTGRISRLLPLTNIAMDQTSWLDLSADGDTPTSPSPPQSPRKAHLWLSLYQLICFGIILFHEFRPNLSFSQLKSLLIPQTASSPSKLTRSKSIIERVASRASEYSISPNTSRSEDQLVGRSGLPPWDRTVDIVFHKYKHGDAKPDKNVALKALTNKFFALHKRQKPKASEKGQEFT